MVGDERFQRGVTKRIRRQRGDVPASRQRTILQRFVRLRAEQRDGGRAGDFLGSFVASFEGRLFLVRRGALGALVAVAQRREALFPLARRRQAPRGQQPEPRGVLPHRGDVPRGTSPPSTRPSPRITVSARRWCFPAKSAWQYRNRSSGSRASPSPLMLTSLSAKNTAESSRCFSRQSRTPERSFSSVARGTRGVSGGPSMVPSRAHGRSGARSREDEFFPDGTT